jgi:hypothetical protein
MAKFVEEHEAPEDAEQAIRVPEWKRNAQPYIADRINSERVGDGPHASGKHSPNNQVRSLANIIAHMRRATNERGNAPSREKDSAHHDQRNGDGRDVWIDQLDWSFGPAEPGPGGETAEDS